MIQSTHMERKQTMNHKLRTEPTCNLEVKYREVAKHDKSYILQHTSPIYYPPKKLKYPERYFLDLLQTVTHQPEVNHLENIEIHF